VVINFLQGDTMAIIPITDGETEMDMVKMVLLLVKWAADILDLHLA